MKKLSLHKENLAELSSDEMANIAGAVPNGGSDRCTIIVSAGSCVCGFDGGRCDIDVSSGSCLCGTA